MAWLWLVLAGLLEVVWAIGLKYTDGFTRLVPSAVTVAAMIASVYFLALAVRTIPIGTGYAVWTGIGAVGVAILGMILFGEPKTVQQLPFPVAFAEKIPQVHVWEWPGRFGEASLLVTEGFSDAKLIEPDGAPAGRRVELLTVARDAAWAGNALRLACRAIVHLYNRRYMGPCHTMAMLAKRGVPLLASGPAAGAPVEGEPYHVFFTSDGSRAAESALASFQPLLHEAGARVNPPKLILLDLKMPRLDGRAALRELRAHEATRHVPVVVVSSSRQQRDVRDCYELGANSFVVKRFDPHAPGEYLVSTVRYWLDMNQVAP